MTSKLQCIIIDDSQSAIQNLGKAIELYFSSELEVLQSFNNPYEALELIQEVEPDIIFLDIEMPELNGFQLYDLIPNTLKDRIVIYSGIGNYGIKVINEMEVSGFVSKPIVLQDLRKSIEKAKQKLKKTLALKKGHRENLYKDFIVINGQTKTILLSVDKINRLESEGPYTTIFYNNTFEKSSKHLRFFEETLNPNKFIRVDRQNIVNINLFKEINKLNYINELILNDGHVIKLSKEKLKNLMEKIEGVLSGD